MGQPTQHLDLTQEETDRLLLLVNEAQPYMERMFQSRNVDDHMPAALADALRATVNEFAAARGFNNCRISWSFDGKAVKVSVQLPEQTGSG